MAARRQLSGYITYYYLLLRLFLFVCFCVFVVVVFFFLPFLLLLTEGESALLTLTDGSFNSGVGRRNKTQGKLLAEMNTVSQAERHGDHVAS